MSFRVVDAWVVNGEEQARAVVGEIEAAGDRAIALRADNRDAAAKALARDLGSRGITANVVHPGSTDTDMNPATGPHAEHQRQKVATPRFGKAEEKAGMVAWLTGPEGRFVTGAALTIDGGANA
ncbi:MAG: SDR family oxidoreductase [Mesorhizobium sp.]|nr:MAG: SDR family oxidoreductase [Mesorhizobium sp.]